MPDRPEEITEEVPHGLRNAKRCAFDQILKYFLYQVLDPNSPEKAKLDELQTEIEQLQEGRYYTLEGDGSNPTNESQESWNFNASHDPTASSSVYSAPVTEAVIEVIQPEESKREANADPENDDVRKPRELELVKSRREIMNRLLNTSIAAILHIANDNSIRSLQIEFQKAFQSGLHENERYGPYVAMCNAIFGALASQNIPGFRERSVLDIKFQVLDSSTIRSNFEGADIDVQRKADAGGLSEAAFQKIPELAPPESPIAAVVAPPGELLRGWLILLSQEFRISDGNNPHGMILGLDNHKYALPPQRNGESADKLPLPVPEAARETKVIQGPTKQEDLHSCRSRDW
ncbi:hypothetical protein CVT26_003248 [Gymnopilus dilepis]|uniref:Uncharacterized protein n=1 Tax=Gymnopilus dilepis TaxID=231916 RepID=A0A409Y4Z8_9AGAR|nr:hypothetical protein CVT26_003248 [Gymnopilus dilepis]